MVRLRRNWFSSEQRLELKKLYPRLFRSGAKLSSAVAAARQEFTSEAARLLLDFASTTKRGLCADVSVRKAAHDSESAGE